MNAPLASAQLDRLNGVEFVVRHPILFKAQLGIGADAYSSLWLGRHLQRFWDVGGVALTGAQVAKSAAIATTFFSSQGWLAAIGLGGAAATPIGWVAAAAVASAGTYYGVTRLLKEFASKRVVEVPAYISTPLDILAISLFDLIAPLALIVASADGEMHEREIEEIVEHFVDDWGLDKNFVETALSILTENVSPNDFASAALALSRFKSQNPDCNSEHISQVVLSLLRGIARADGNVSTDEERLVESIATAFSAPGLTSRAAKPLVRMIELAKASSQGIASAINRRLGTF